MVDINDYREEKSCIYKDEEYLVRDNGAVLRKSRPNKKARKLDDEWTWGRLNKKGYLEGIKFGLIMIVIILIFNLLIFKNEFNLISILYYLSLLFVSTIGSMIGIKRKSN